eukprot:TRINITY_DN1338_c0_g1_i1.p1 TRINITY_DN1338_c0_g1~~TRINITY_DN1338_c0_g1_i1.p1  ORF type:complete len:133 (-),score=17.14 TRINITY_DN1338_c0_g1_i1:316-714(-)
MMVPYEIAPPAVVRGKERSSTKSDVWALGIFLWEMFTAAAPASAAGYGCRNSHDYVSKVSKGALLARPGNCKKGIYFKVMRPCWALDKDLRPSLATLSKTLTALEEASFAVAYPRMAFMRDAGATGDAHKDQ